MTAARQFGLVPRRHQKLQLWRQHTNISSIYLHLHLVTAAATVTAA